MGWGFWRLALVGFCALTPFVVRAQSEQQTLVDRATLAAQELLNDHDGRDAQNLLRRARAVIICPQVFRAGFLFGAQGGSCVLVARDGAGSWSSPAFYSMGSASFGFQAGLQDSQIMMMLLTERGLRAIMDDQFKVGADAGATFVQWGGGIEGATTGAVGADIVGFARSRGLFAGISLSGSIFTTRSAWNKAYYGHEEAAQQIVVSMDANNPAASPLREILGRFQQLSPSDATSAAAAGFPAASGSKIADAYQPKPSITLLPAPELRKIPVQQQSLSSPQNPNRY